MSTNTNYFSSQDNPGDFNEILMSNAFGFDDVERQSIIPD